MMKKGKRYISKVLSLFCICALLIGSVSLSFGISVKAEDSDGNPVLVALGDSYSSGEGIEKFFGQDESLRKKVENPDWLAHRSENAWSGMLKLPGVDGELNKHRDDNWYFVAASGATTNNINGAQTKNYYKTIHSSMTLMSFPLSDSVDLAAQIEVFERLKNENKQADYVTMTMGGNDADFVGVIKEAATGVFSPNKLRDKLNNTWKNFYETGGIYDSLEQAYNDISDAAGSQARIIVAGYPKLIDPNGFNLFKNNVFKKENAEIVNDSVVQFNKEIERLVGICASKGMNICFVSVEKAFENHGLGADNSFINPVSLGAKSQDINENDMISAYSVHPNLEGAKAYAKCVQDAIDDYEKEKAENGEEKTTEPTTDESSRKKTVEREAVLVLDVSGSMDGDKLEQTKVASKKFIETMTNNDAKVALVTYSDDSRIESAFSKDKDDLNKRVDRLETRSSTNIESGLSTANTLLRTSDAEKKIIVLMSDGAANVGKTGDSLIEYANELKDSGVLIYTLGFFGGYEGVSEEQRVMEGIASPGCHYEVDDAESLVFFFGDIADQLSGEQYIYVRIACPVDVEVEYKNEKLTSQSETSQRTAFGTITFEENPNDSEGSGYSDNRIKILRLKQGPDYNIRINGNGSGVMNYSIKLADKYGEYIDSRDFNDIEINSNTVIDTVANSAEKSVMKIDSEGDGEYDLIYEASANSVATLVEDEPEKEEEKPFNIWLIILPVGGAIILLIAFFVIRKKVFEKRNALIEKYSDYIEENNIK